MSLAAGGGGPREVTTRYLGERVAPAGPAPRLRPAAIASRTSACKATCTPFDWRWSRGAPDARHARRRSRRVSRRPTAAFTVQRADRRDLVMAPFRASPEPAARRGDGDRVGSGDRVHAPRWSPDGRAIAVERHVRGALPEIVLVDVATGAISAVVASRRARCVSPAWMPDGRRLLYASNPGGEPFRLFAVELATGADRAAGGHRAKRGVARRVARWADVSLRRLHTRRLRSLHIAAGGRRTGRRSPMVSRVAHRRRSRRLPARSADRPYTPWRTMRHASGRRSSSATTARRLLVRRSAARTRSGGMATTPRC